MNRAQRRNLVKQKVSADDLNKILKQENQRVLHSTVRGYSAAVTLVLRDKLKFGRTRVERTLNQIQELFDSINKGLLNIDDIEQVIKDELNIEFK